MAKKITLQGCPFCGGKAWWTKGDASTGMLDKVSCMQCFAEIEETYKPQSALEKWNMRTLDHEVMKASRMVNIDGENL